MSLTLQSQPRISPATFARVLADAGSPAAPEAAACYEAIVAHGIDPAVGLAFFAHESTYGTRGKAVSTRNWGNLRRSQGRALGVRDGFAVYERWADSAGDFASLLRSRYVGRGLTTVADAIPVYAPSSDGNKPAAYIAAVEGLVARWVAAERTVEDRRYVVAAQAGANVRERPRTSAPRLRTLAQGQVVSVDHIIADGEAVAGSPRWAALSGGGFVWAGLLKRYEEGK